MLLLEKKTYSLSQNSHTWIRLFPSSFEWVEMVISIHFSRKDLGTIIQLKQPFKNVCFGYQVTIQWWKPHPYSDRRPRRKRPIYSILEGFPEKLGEEQRGLHDPTIQGEKTFDIDECLWLWGQWATRGIGLMMCTLRETCTFPVRSRFTWLTLSTSVCARSLTDWGLPVNPDMSPGFCGRCTKGSALTRKCSMMLHHESLEKWPSPNSLQSKTHLIATKIYLQWPHLWLYIFESCTLWLFCACI